MQSPTNDGFGILRPTIELPFNDILSSDDFADSPDSYSTDPTSASDVSFTGGDKDVHHQTSSLILANESTLTVIDCDEIAYGFESETDDLMSTTTTTTTTTLTDVPSIPQSQSQTNNNDCLAPSVLCGPTSGLRAGPRANTPGRPTLTVRTQPLTRFSGPSAIATNVNPSVLRSW